MSGKEGLVGDKGAGVIRASESLNRFGVSNSVILYEGMNHDILHEDGHLEVFSDILKWINAII